MKHRTVRDFKPGDKVQVCWGVTDGPRDVSCVQGTVFSVLNGAADAAAAVGLALTDKNDQLVMVSAHQVTFISHEGVW